MSLLSIFKRKKVLSWIAYQIKPRKVKLDWQETPVDWIPNEPFSSYFLSTKSI